MGGTDQTIQKLKERRAALKSMQEQAEEQLIHRASVEFRAGRITEDDLLEVSGIVRVSCSARCATRWASAGLPLPVDIQRRINYRPNCPDGSWWQQSRFVRSGSRPPSGQAVVYVLYDEAGEPCYVGSTGDLQRRLIEHRREKTFDSWRAWPCIDRIDAYRRESEMLRTVMPALNRRR